MHLMLKRWKFLKVENRLCLPFHPLYLCSLNTPWHAKAEHLLKFPWNILQSAIWLYTLYTLFDFDRDEMEEEDNRDEKFERAFHWSQN